MKNYKHYIGIDVSKKTLDFHIVNSAAKMIIIGKISNDLKGIKELFKELRRHKISKDESLFCFENTGVYSMNLCMILFEFNIDFAHCSALEIKQSKGICRGKSDKADAKDIALYALRNIDKIRLSDVPETDILTLKLLYAEREKTVAAIKDFGSTEENKNFLPKVVYRPTEKINKKTLIFLKKMLLEIERSIREIIHRNNELQQQKKLLLSVLGIGEVTSLYLLLAIKGFKSFPNWRKFACYCGIVPFEYSSGTSIRGKSKVSHFADKKMKSILHLAALSAIKHDAEIRTYYERKKQEGKHSLLVINNVKCKIISRAFAVIARNEAFVNTYKFAS
ncbi:transposase [Chryseobacterium aahli]|uniref:transposase n=1 Tax=Chryseobacterium aahli TaxID=1278643 RepID=UPI001F60B5C2|nr:transposase [Chryseobacterium aahli]MCI3939536.1 transposase [Chryseobacterium aahli]